MAKETEKQLKERWLTPEGKKVKKQIIDHIKEGNWEMFLVEFPFVEEVENKKDLRFIDLSSADLRGAYFLGANLSITKMNKGSL